ncbi:DNA polymerase III subunit gamma/tau [uncultured Marinobacter sp.]|uniref:DNA polymerase III subunit gamma/tau n=1 Tax=uncultured Marinobacter sp. TaxID=187379 RepID=UPI0030DB21AE
MSYQVLARKWRPKTFQDMVGQEHVLQALVHALEHNRLHHAYLFTGTRGVGKTTIGRLLARCLNCETGVTANPCGECGSCREILENRFVDLIEIDAASRTGVDDMRELTDNVQYAPSRGRFKVYLIDEVHMLTNQSFNAFLKTLEEPPEHVKFLLATTDPQKLPVTVLSRCLQFNLKRMTPEHIVGHLRYVLGEEQIPFEEPALWQLARAADGSMRDALSLTDQAIAFGNQKLATSDVSSMLGTIDQRDIETLVDALVAGDGPALLAEIHRIAGFSPDYGAILTDLLSLFHRITTEQVVPGSADNALGDAHRVQALARELSAEDAQVFYQSALIGRKDLAITPDARMGFEMTMLRMLAFRPGAERREPPLQVATGRSSADHLSGAGQRGREGRDEGTGPSSGTGGEAAEEPAPADVSVDVAMPATPSAEAPSSEALPAHGAPVAEPEAETAPVTEQPVRQAPEQHAASLPEPTDTVPSPPAPQPSAVVAPDASAVVQDDASPEQSMQQPPETELSADEAALLAMADQAVDQYDEDAEYAYDDYPEPTATRAESEASRVTSVLEQVTSMGRKVVHEVAPEPGEHTPVSAEPRTDSEPAPAPLAEAVQGDAAQQPAVVTEVPAETAVAADTSDFHWPRDFRKLGIVGMPGNLASQAECRREGDRFVLMLDEGHYRLLNDRHQQKILEGLKGFFGASAELVVENAPTGDQTPVAWEARAKAERQQQAEASIETDPLVRAIVERFDGRVVKESIRPADSATG